MRAGVENGDPAYDQNAVQALIRAFVACRLAIGALPDLPEDVRGVVDEPIKTLCAVLGPELERVRPGSTTPG